MKRHWAPTTNQMSRYANACDRPRKPRPLISRQHNHLSSTTSLQEFGLTCMIKRACLLYYILSRRHWNMRVHRLENKYQMVCRICFPSTFFSLHNLWPSYDEHLRWRVLSELSMQTQLFIIPFMPNWIYAHSLTLLFKRCTSSSVTNNWVLDLAVPRTSSLRSLQAVCTEW